MLDCVITLYYSIYTKNTMKIKIEDYILLGGTLVVQWESIATQTPFFTGFFASQNYSIPSPAFFIFPVSTKLTVFLS